MMRKLAEQQPGAIKFDEPAVRVTFGRFLSVPAFGKVWLLCEGTKPVGYVVLARGFSFEFHGHDAFIDELYIEAAFGRRGYGRRAVAFVDRKPREMGLNAIHPQIGRGNDPACELSRRAGYPYH